MKYSKELHDTLVKSNYYDSHIINALLDEIDRLNAEMNKLAVFAAIHGFGGYSFSEPEPPESEG